MLELRFIRENLDLVQERCNRRGMSDELITSFTEIDQKRLSTLAEVESLKNKRNVASKEIAELKRGTDEQKLEAEPLILEMRQIGDKIKILDTSLNQIQEDLDKVVMAIPNLCQDDVPVGNSDEENIELRVWGKKPEFTFTPKAHYELGEEADTIDFERAAKISGARFAILKGFASRLDRALTNFMLDLHTQKHGYTEVLPPFLVNSASLTATGQLPKFKEDLFAIKDWDLYLIPTAEVPVTNIHRDETIAEQDLPIKYTAFTPCFRSEAGSHGRDTRGLVRQHQFNKVELVKFTTPERSTDELESLLGDAEEVLQLLGLHYRVVKLCTGDLGFSSSKTYDIEVWLPGQQKYREISSCSNFLDFQARRGGIRYRPEGQKKSKLVHTLNGSGLAVGRTLLAVMENYQQEDGSITIPEVLKPYFENRF
ncbi:serine--tRNA ligase [Desulfotalea psychrophila]|uniref:Serine--tRNA ligase n=1 Tax=Desulfotalea psychrophila (strain LSv54 / DSM 12343) TaxID=177439 RepID=SYS_DESPS|nr:serine--tRNA ligase [Desulfotalea psychrophila]Q6AMD2.1 RecName: Full=Serine--tRNA ligase; AltName: Full=Seryl-tRNA synthetase; Short=SerRS; AltName: Full=Seryl-tRNA(Ser/Sec) synthetase [Desulfotalea psychrophila LSv54]CAG36493.1 probable seryl-tRNA synthetase [Desulfotalea psychrophila LSv54]